MKMEKLNFGVKKREWKKKKDENSIIDKPKWENLKETLKVKKQNKVRLKKRKKEI